MFAYGAYSLNESVRLKSSSGGIFYEIAKYVLDNDGIVYAARFDSDYKVKHDSCSNIEDLYLFMGSKYVQSKRQMLGYPNTSTLTPTCDVRVASVLL